MVSAAKQSLSTVAARDRNDTEMEYLTLALALASLLLHYFAPKTKTKLDDEALELVDAAKDALDKSK